jgi:protein O-GlcNAc transferase
MVQVDPLALQSRAVAAWQAGRVDEAVALLEHAIALRPSQLPYAHAIRAEIWRQAGQLDSAIADLAVAVGLAPFDEEVLLRLCDCFADSGVPERALAALEASKIDSASVRMRRASVLQSIGHRLEALSAYNELIARFGLVEPAVTNRALLQHELQQYRHALSGYELALKIDFSNQYALMGRAVALQDLGYVEQACEAYRSLPTRATDFSIRSNEILCHAYLPGAQVKRSELARSFGESATRCIAQPFSDWRCEEAVSRLTIGLVSADLKSHPVGYFLEGVLSSIDASRIELIAFGPKPADDPVSKRLERYLTSWEPLPSSDFEAAKRIHSHAPHIVIDLSGHTAGNRLPVFAYRPAPVQVSWLGYFGTTGLSQIDYVLADPISVPAAGESEFIERIWRLPETRLCFTAPSEAPVVGPPPCLVNGHLTFGYFGNYSKINRGVLQLWSEVLTEVSTSRLLLKGAIFEDVETQRELAQFFDGRGVSPSRLQFEGFSSRASYLASYEQVDVMLDTFPFPGGTTTAEALWMGVPVLTLRGSDMLSRQGESLLANAGLTTFIADSTEHYVEIAVSLSRSHQGLADLRAGLRETLKSAPLYDAPRFARHWEAALWGMWEEWLVNRTSE